MTRMPTHMSDGTKVPAIPKRQWDALVAALIGRETTAGERERIEKMANRNWTARIVAEKIIGRDLSEEEVAAAHKVAGTA